MSYTPLANVLKKNLRDLRKYIIRDYNEIEELQSSIKDSNVFIQKSQTKIEENAYSKNKSTNETNEVTFTEKKDEIELADELTNARKKRRRSSASIE